MALTRVHNFNSSGAMLSSGVDDPTADADPMANLPPGTRVHKDGAIDDPPVLTPEAAARLQTPKSKAKARSSKLVGKSDSISDRRRCLELAIQSGADTPDEILAAAQRFAAFLEG